MTESERAAALADRIETLSPIIAFQTMTKEKRDAAEALIIAALRAYSAPVSTDAELREAVAKVVPSEGIHSAFRRHSDSLEAIKAWDALAAIPDDDWQQIMVAISYEIADAALSAIHASGWRIVPAEPTDAIIDAAFNCPEYAVAPEGRGRMAAMIRAAIAAERLKP